MPTSEKGVSTHTPVTVTGTEYEATPNILLGTNPLDDQASKTVPNKNDLPLTFLSLEYQTKYSNQRLYTLKPTYLLQASSFL